MTRRRQRERGTAILITMIVIVALLGGGAVLVGMQMSSTRSTDVTRSSMTSLYCAEAGVNAARKVVANNYTADGTFNSGLGIGSQPAYLNAANIDHDLDPNDAVTTDDFRVVLEDNDDEVGITPSATIDNDLTIYIVSTCTKFAENQKQVRELIKIRPGTGDYNGLSGGAGNNNNANPN